MRKLILYSCFFLATVFTATNSQAVCEALLKRSSASIPRVRITKIVHPVLVPSGIDPKAFRAFGEEILNMDGTDAIIIFGSRTHFSYGMEPNSKSDLDVAVLFREPATDAQKSDVAEAARKLEDATSIPVTLPLAEWNANLRTGMDSSEKSFRLPPDAATEEALMSSAAENSRTWFFGGRNYQKEVLSDLLSKTYDYKKLFFNKEAVIIIKKSADAASTYHKLRSFGFRNVYYAN